MRRSPSVHNALVLNLRSGDANLDVRRRSPPLAISFSLFLYLSFSRYDSPSRPAIITVSLLSPTSFKLLLSYMFSLFLSSTTPPLFLSRTRFAQAADDVATWLAICYSQPYAMNNCDVTPPRRKTRFLRRRRNRFLHGDDEEDDDNATTMTPMRASLIRENYDRRLLTSAPILIPIECSIGSFRVLFQEQNLHCSRRPLRLAANSTGTFLVFRSHNLVSVSRANPKYP